MLLEELKLTHFKNYEQQSLQFAPQLNCFLGLNGMGKTNLLEAIYYLCMCRSPLGLNDRHLARHGSDFFRLEGGFRDGEEQYRIVAKVQPGKRKEFSRNRVAYPVLSEHIGLIRVVFVSPFDLDLIREGSEERRRFLDNSLSQLDPEYLRQLIRYNKVLQQRNQLLKQFAEHQTFNADLLAALTEQLLDPGRYLYQARHQLVRAMQPLVDQTVNKLSAGKDQIGLHYRCQLTDTPFEDLLEASIEKDRALQRTTCGPHKDDLQLSLYEQPLKRYGSQGQTKSIVLALKLAQYELLWQQGGHPPLLLLDDIFDRLDVHRVEALLDLIAGSRFGQVFVTDTEEQRLDGLIRARFPEYRKFRIASGSASRIENPKT